MTEKSVSFNAEELLQRSYKLWTWWRWKFTTVIVKKHDDKTIHTVKFTVHENYTQISTADSMDF